MTIKYKTTPEEAFARALPFLSGIATSDEVRKLMGEAGYTKAEHDHGAALLVSISDVKQVQQAMSNGRAVAGAIEQVGRWSERGFARAHAALLRLHPEQHAFVFQNLEAGKGKEGVVAVRVFIDRLDELESGAARTETREADHAALETLAQRGITKVERTRLRDLTTLALTTTDDIPVEQPEEKAKRLATLTELAAWFDDWATTARAVLIRRDHFIKLGLAKRRKHTTAENDNAPDTTTTETPEKKEDAVALQKTG